MWWHCYIFQNFVLAAVYSEWDAGFGQVEFRGTTGGRRNDRGTAFDGSHWCKGDMQRECSASSGCSGESLTRAEQNVDWGGRVGGKTATKLSLVGQVSTQASLVAELGEVMSPGSTQGRFKDLVYVAVKFDLHMLHIQ